MGNTLGTAKISKGRKMVFPKKVAEELNVGEGDYIAFIKVGKKIVVEKIGGEKNENENIGSNFSGTNVSNDAT